MGPSSISTIERRFCRAMAKPIGRYRLRRLSMMRQRRGNIASHAAFRLHSIRSRVRRRFTSSKAFIAISKISTFYSSPNKIPKSRSKPLATKRVSIASISTTSRLARSEMYRGAVAQASNRRFRFMRGRCRCSSISIRFALGATMAMSRISTAINDNPRTMPKNGIRSITARVAWQKLAPQIARALARRRHARKN